MPSTLATAPFDAVRSSRNDAETMQLMGRGQWWLNVVYTRIVSSLDKQNLHPSEVTAGTLNKITKP